jgi:hypothetical protein
MIANPTTLILGAGASKPFGYPTGAELRQQIISRVGMSYNAPIYDELLDRFRWSLVSSIDAFLAEKENHHLQDVGRVAIVAALHQVEHQSQTGDWYELLFNAIRGLPSSERTHPIRIVTFNYDRSLEHFICEAFKNTYALSSEDALKMFNESIEIVHVYGDIGALPQLEPNEPSARAYGANLTHDGYVTASKRIEIIERAETSPKFERAREVIATATFLGILGFGYDQTNVANLDLARIANEKRAFSTGFRLGYGVRGWIRRMGLSDVFIGAEADDVRGFLHNSGFLQWANTPGKTAHEMQAAIHHYFKNSALRLPY